MYEDLGASVAYQPPTFGVPRTPLTTTRTPLQTYFNTTTVTPTPSPKPSPITQWTGGILPRPILPAPSPVKPTVTAIPVSTTKLPVSLAKPTPLTPDTFGTPSAAPGSPSVNVSVSGGAGVSPSGSVTPEIGTMSAGMFGFSDVNPTTLIFLGMAALVVFMESGKKGRR